MQHIAYQTNFESFDSAAVIPNRQKIEQALRGVLVPAITGVDHVRGNSLGQETRGT